MPHSQSGEVSDKKHRSRCTACGKRERDCKCEKREHHDGSDGHRSHHKKRDESKEHRDAEHSDCEVVERVCVTERDVIVRNGRDGKAGRDGRNGTNGRDGERGPRGHRGEHGEPGIRGERGHRGRDGSRGKPGKNGKDSVVPGPRGERGDVGERGERGEKGERGEPGVVLPVTLAEVKSIAPASLTDVIQHTVIGTTYAEQTVVPVNGAIKFDMINVVVGPTNPDMTAVALMPGGAYIFDWNVTATADPAGDKVVHVSMYINGTLVKDSHREAAPTSSVKVSIPGLLAASAPTDQTVTVELRNAGSSSFMLSPLNGGPTCVLRCVRTG